MFDEGGTAVLGIAFAEDEEALTGAGKGHVEEVEVINHGLEVFVVVSGFEDRTAELFLTVIHRN